MKKNIVMSAIMAGGLLMGDGLSAATDSMAVLQDALTLLNDGPKLVASYKGAQKKINAEIALLKEKGISDQEKSLAAVNLINESIVPLQELIALFKTIDHLIVSSGVPKASEAIEKNIDPIVKRAVIMLKTIRQATEILQTTIGGSEAVTPAEKEKAAAAEEELAPLP